MSSFHDLQFKPHDSGVAACHSFANGYTVSVIQTEYSYGGRDGKYELAVMRDGEPVYDTPVTDDVLGHLSEDAVTKAMQEVEALPAKVQP